jgi:alpha-tubulin suppressor-like RCC1 family protein
MIAASVVLEGGMRTRAWVVTSLLVLASACEPIGLADGPSSGPGNGSGHGQESVHVLAIATGAEHSLALSDAGEVWSWGRNSEGQLGDGTTTDRWTPQRIGGLPVIRAIAAGSDLSLAIDVDGGVWRWGRISHDQLGAVSEPSAGGILVVPEALPSPQSVEAIAAGGTLGPQGVGHSLAVDADGRVWSWGYNIRGQLGQGDTGSRHEPGLIGGLTQIVGVAAGGFSSLALTEDGSLWAWGSNAAGQLGDGTFDRRRVPTPVTIARGLVNVDAGGDADRVHVLALNQDGTVWAWGANDQGQLGDPGGADRPRAQVVAGVPPAVDVAAGDGFSLALDTSRRVWHWGGSGRADVGDVAVGGSAPNLVEGLTNVLAVAAGAGHALAVDGGGRVWSWGANHRGQLGIGEAGDVTIPRRVAF